MTALLRARSSAAATSPAAAPASQPIQPLLVLNLRGSQAEMGAQHGRLLRAHGGHEAALAFYPELPERLLRGGLEAPARRLVERWGGALKQLLLGRLERDRPREYLERTRAFNQALGWPSSHSRHLLVMDLFQNVVGLIGRLGLPPLSRRATAAAVPACSTLVVWGGASADGALRHARNFDFPGIGIWDRAPVVALCTPERGVRYGFVTTRGADLPGVTAFNEAGLTVTAHTRFHRSIRFSGASVVDLGHDIARRAESLADALAIARERPVSSSWGLAVSSARERRAIVVETAGDRVEAALPHTDHLTCANRYRHAATRRGEVDASAAWAAHSDAREARLHDLVEQGRPRGGLARHDLEQALADQLDPDAPAQPRGAGGVVSQPATVQSIVAEPEQRALHVSIGPAPASQGPFVRVPWDWEGPVGAVQAAAAAPARPQDAFAHYVEAARLEVHSHDLDAVLVELEHAVRLSPDDPSYRFLAGCLALRQGHAPRALAHLLHGLGHEVAPFRRGQLTFWAARAADVAGQPARAAALRSALQASADPRLAELRARARRDQTQRFDAAGAARLQLNMMLCDAL
ncbi:MAG: hypothetical protein IT370_13675 [Deltaproteobacteria bacterium]|nr:hypothetical protein [Deltaproteobacteria bacterium]